jgi:hypothetical protein
MSWDYSIAIEYGEEEALAERFVRIAKAMAATSIFGSPSQIGVYDYDAYIQFGHRFKTARVEHFVETYDQPIDWELIQRSLDRFVEDRYCFEVTWARPRYWWWTSKDVIEEDWKQVALHVCGNGFPMSAAVVNFPSTVVYSVAEAKYYDVSIFGEPAERNLKLVRDELEFLTSLGAMNFYGLNVEEENNPLAWSLCYHHSPQGFLDDLKKIKPDIPLPTHVDETRLRMAQQNSENVELRSLQQGLLVYSTQGTGGDLEQFYKNL